MTKVVRNRFAELLASKGRRESRRITQQAAADETGLSVTTINRYVLNKVERYESDTILTLCQYLDCSPGDLIIVEEGNFAPERKTPMLATA